MPRVSGTAGQVLINEILPPDLRDINRALDKKTLGALLSEVAKTHPDKYRDISHRLNQIGREAAYTSGGNSFGLRHLLKAKVATKLQQEARKKVDALLDDDSLDDKQREAQILKIAGKLQELLPDAVLKESLDEGNPLALQLMGAGRGNKINLSTLRAADSLYQDYRGNVIPIPVFKSYSEGLSPLEYWAGTYGTRLGVLSTKFAVRDSGDLAKQLAQASHRSIVTGIDSDKEPSSLVGLPVDSNDNDSEGSLLAQSVGTYKRNTILTPKILADIRKSGIKRILVRSPAVSGAPDGGLYARDVGIREFNRLPHPGEIPGFTAAQALSEPLSQSGLSAKHQGGIAGQSKAVSGFDYINSLVQIPKTFPGGATHAETDGLVQSITPAPAGGFHVNIENQQHYVPTGFDVSVKRGDKVEAGDVISSGEPNPALITKYKGIGEGRRYFINTYMNGMKGAGLKAHRRNVEILARALINHVRLTDEIGDYAPDDVVPYSLLEHNYLPREGFKTTAPRAALGKYLERPYLHFSIGTQIKPSMLKDFDDFGIKMVDVHNDPPPFEPEMIRGRANLHYDPDWMTRMYGSGLKGSLLDSVHRGGISNESGTSFVPSRAKAVDFGRVGPFKLLKGHK